MGIFKNILGYFPEKHTREDVEKLERMVGDAFRSVLMEAKDFIDNDFDSGLATKEEKQKELDFLISLQYKFFKLEKKFHKDPWERVKIAEEWLEYFRQESVVRMEEIQKRFDKLLEE
jgi:hypothetical protein